PIPSRRSSRPSRLRRPRLPGRARVASRAACLPASAEPASSSPANQIHLVISYCLPSIVRFYDLDDLAVKLVGKRPEFRIVTRLTLWFFFFESMRRFGFRFARDRSLQREPPSKSLFACVLDRYPFVASFDVSFAFRVLGCVGHSQVVAVDRDRSLVERGNDHHFAFGFERAFYSISISACRGSGLRRGCRCFRRLRGSDG